MTTAIAQQGHGYTDDQIDLIKRTVCKNATNDEFALFIQVANKTGLDPFTKQIHAVKRWDGKAGREVMSIQTGIDGFRLIAERTGDYEGQTPPQWCGKDGVWRDVWLETEPPAAARIGVYRKGFREPLYRVARYRSYVQMGKEGPNRMWKQMDDVMIAKCAEALALRAAFPQDLSGLYTADEMGQADHVDDAEIVTPRDRPKQLAAAPADPQPDFGRLLADRRQAIDFAATFDALKAAFAPVMKNGAEYGIYSDDEVADLVRRKDRRKAQLAPPSPQPAAPEAPRPATDPVAADDVPDAEEVPPAGDKPDQLGSLKRRLLDQLADVEHGEDLAKLVDAADADLCRLDPEHLKGTLPSLAKRAAGLRDRGDLSILRGTAITKAANAVSAYLESVCGDLFAHAPGGKPSTSAADAIRG